MAHDHGEAGHSHDHTAGANAKMLRWALALTATYLVAEVVGAFVFNSLALLSDAAHMMTDVAGLVIALMAIHLGKKAADDKRTFGYKRLEILAATFNAILLFVVAMYILYEAIQRFREPQSIQSTGMLIVAVIGLVVNFVSMRLLTAGKDESFNVKGGSVGVILGALAIRFTGWTWVDPVIAIGIGLWVLPRTWVLLKGTINVLLEGVPGGLKLPEIRSTIAAIPGVAGVHDLHVWSMASDEINCTAHVTLGEGVDPDSVRVAVTRTLDERFGIEHSTIQTEAPSQACEDDQHLHR
jgi:cobalt-zinc-cadmium efflux system protein